MDEPGQPIAWVGPPGPLHHRCAWPDCQRAGDTLLRCAGCKAVRYCSREHQLHDRPEHKKSCNHIKKLRDNLEEAEDRVPRNYFEINGHYFWDDPITVDYMEIRKELSLHLSYLRSLDGVREALEHMLDLNHLGQAHNGCTRVHIPLLMLQLDQDQAAYTFVKRTHRFLQAWRSFKPIYQVMEAFYSIDDADVFEEVDVLDSVLDLSHIIAILLLKLKLVVDISNLRLVRKVIAGRLPVDLWEDMQHAIIRSPLAAKLIRHSNEELLHVHLELCHQIQKIGRYAERSNSYLIKALLVPDQALKSMPVFNEPPSEGSPDEATAYLSICLPAWKGTEGVSELLHQAGALAVLYPEREALKTMIGRDNSKKSVSDIQMEVAKMAETAPIEVWEYLPLAVENASSLDAVQAFGTAPHGGNRGARA